MEHRVTIKEIAAEAGGSTGCSTRFLVHANAMFNLTVEDASTLRMS